MYLYMYPYVITIKFLVHCPKTVRLFLKQQFTKAKNAPVHVSEAAEILHIPILVWPFVQNSIFQVKITITGTYNKYFSGIILSCCVLFLCSYRILGNLFVRRRLHGNLYSYILLSIFSDFKGLPLRLVLLEELEEDGKLNFYVTQ